MVNMNKGVRLVLTPHMDSEVIGMGGTIAILVKSGYQVVVVYLTDGAAAYEGRVLQGSERQQFSSRRKSEAKEALGILGDIHRGVGRRSRSPRCSESGLPPRRLRGGRMR
jgi:LmbE family N-acetylglucosaminyl deacetylase